MTPGLSSTMLVFVAIGMGVSALGYAQPKANILAEQPIGTPRLNLMVPSRPPAQEPPLTDHTHRDFPLGGAILLGASYALPFGLAVRFDERLLYIPIFGPLAELTRCRDCTGSNVQKLVITVLVLDAAVQGLGAFLVVRGIVGREPPRPSSPKMSIAPTFFTSGIGVGAWGQF